MLILLSGAAALRTPVANVRAMSLLECELPIDTPRSRPKYSERDIDALRREKDEALTQVSGPCLVFPVYRLGQVVGANF
jgi:hypothetical protein